MALYLTWNALLPQGDLPLKHGVVSHKHHYPQRGETLPPLHLITAQLPSLLLKCLFPLIPSFSTSAHQGNEVFPFVLGTSDKQRHLG